MKNVSSSRVRIQNWPSSLLQVLAMTVVILGWTQLGYAQTLIDCASSSNVQSQINGAAPGAYLKCNGTGPYSWSPFQVSIPSTVALTLDGNGASVNGGILISANASLSTRVTNFTLTASGNNTNAQASILVNTCNFTSARWRVDHVTFTGSGSNIVALNQCPGVFDHNSMTNGQAANELVHVMGWGATNTTGWTTAMPSGNSAGSRALGSDEAIYFENNTFSASSYSNSNPSWIQSYYGARVVYRHNTFNYVKTDAHGGSTQVGTRWWEFYNNDYHEMAGGNAGGYSHNLRAGSGIIFNETYSGTINPQPNIGMCNETPSSYPAPYQIGRGTNQVSDPAYSWNNQQTVSLNACEAVTLGGFVAFNRDVYTDVNSASCTAGGSCTSGVGTGTTLPTSCTTGVAFWNPNAGGHWDQTTSNTNDGALYQCTATNTWTLYYTPYTYPHPLITGNVNPPPPPSPPAITSPGSASGTAGSAFSYQITATNLPTGYGASGLPGGLSVNTATGLISGTPTAAGTSSVILSATNSGGTGTATLTLTVNSAPPPVSGFIPSSRMIDWTHAGIPGGIPSANWPISATISPSGGADDSLTIQTAINNAPAGSVIVLNPGTYTLHRASTVCFGKTDDFAFGVYEAGLCLTDKSVVLRGGGTKPGDVVLKYGDGAHIISMGKTYEQAAKVVLTNINSGASKGSTQIVLASTPSFSVNSYIVVNEANPTDPADGTALVNTLGYGNDCSTCGNGRSGYLISQIDKVTAINGNTLTLETPLYFDYTNSPSIFPMPNMIEQVGLENLTVMGTASSGTNLVFRNVNIQSCAHCWVHNVEVDNVVDKSAIYLTDTYGSEISDNYLNNDLWTGSINPSAGSYFAVNHNSGADYSLLLEFRGSQDLIQNNIIRKSRHSIPIAGVSGNVFGYNYLLDPYMGEYPNSLAEDQPHGPHPFMNLWEGNIFPNLEIDFAHGSSSHNTAFRNYVNLTDTNPTTGQSMTGGIIAANIAYYSNYYNIVGNVFGQWPGGCTAGTYESVSPAAAAGNSIFHLGYYNDGGSTSGTAALIAKVGNTLYRGGNWDCKSNGVLWASNAPAGSPGTYLASQALPNSLYLGGKPAWFANVTWPAIDPAATTLVNKIPSQVCYENGPKIGAPFDPVACYGSASTGTTPPSITSATSASGTAGSAFSYQITATNSPTSYGASGLPGGLSVDTATGLISGKPIAAGTSTVTLSATNSAGTGTATLTLTINSPPPAFDFSLSNAGNQTVIQGQSASNTITATLVSGTAQSVSFSASGLPAGATAAFSPGSCSPACSSTLTLTTAASTPAGPSTITVTGTAGSLSHTTSFTLTVTPAANGITLVQSQNKDTLAGGQTSINVSIANSAGNLLVAWCGEGANSTDNFTISDTASNSWTQIGNYVSRGTGARNGLFYSANAGAVTNVTCSFTTAGGIYHPRLMVWEISGAAASSPVDGFASTSSGPSGTTCTSGNLTMTNPNDILILACDVATNQTSPFYTAGSGYTIPPNGDAVRLGMEYQTVSAPQTNVTASMSYTTAAGFDSVFAAFKASALTTFASTPAGSPTTTVTGAAGSLSETTTSTLTVNAPPPPTAAEWTGSGKIAVRGGYAYFGFKVIREASGSLKGRLTFHNAVDEFDFYSTSVLTLSVTGNQAVFTGTGYESLKNGPWSGPFNFTVTVQDPESAGDTFKVDISDSSGTTAGSTTTPIIRGKIEQSY